MLKILESLEKLLQLVGKLESLRERFNGVPLHIQVLPEVVDRLSDGHHALVKLCHLLVHVDHSCHIKRD